MNNINEYVMRNACCGCSVCTLVCPVHAIDMKRNKEGFIYPIVNEEKCINCGLCKKRCAFNHHTDSENDPIIIAAKNKSDEVRMNSRSGGIFTLIADCILSNSGVVYGVAIKEDHFAYHVRVSSKDDLYLLRGSKYIQSEINGAYEYVKDDLKQGKQVLFTGTGCQIAGLKSYLTGEDISNLFLIDIVCHGVPSPKVWKDYIEHYEKKYRGRVEKSTFRNKAKYGWEGSMATLQINGREYDDNLFLDLFNTGLIERESCFQCPYKTMNREGDISLGDFWGINKVSKEFNDHKGVSLVFFNSQKGKAIWDEIKENCDYLIADKNQCKQQALMKPNDYPKDRAYFWKKYMKSGMSFAKLYQYKIKIKRKLGLK